MFFKWCFSARNKKSGLLKTFPPFQGWVLYIHKSIRPPTCSETINSVKILDNNLLLRVNLVLWLHLLPWKTASGGEPLFSIAAFSFSRFKATAQFCLLLDAFTLTDVAVRVKWYRFILLFVQCLLAGRYVAKTGFLFKFTPQSNLHFAYFCCSHKPHQWLRPV